MKTPFKRIKAQSISDQVFGQIKELIFRSELKPGEQILSERELSIELGVSRTSVRNAISRLVALGYLVNRQGQETFVRERNSFELDSVALALGAQEGNLEELLEVRMGLECNAAALAAGRADKNDIVSLEECIEKMKSKIESGRLGTDEDTSFHMAIAYATKNQV